MRVKNPQCRGVFWSSDLLKFWEVSAIIAETVQDI